MNKNAKKASIPTNDREIGRISLRPIIRLDERFGPSHSAWINTFGKDITGYGNALKFPVRGTLAGVH